MALSSDIEKNRILNELPLGVLRCTFEKYPRIIYVNETMKRVLSVKGNESEWENYINGNLFFMLPLSERQKFRTDLKLIENSEKPVKVIHRYIRCDEQQVLLEGWGSTEQAPDGGKEYCFVYGETLEKDDKPEWSNSLFRSLRDAYDILFEMDFARDTLECIYTVLPSERRSLYRIRMQIRGGVQYLLDKYVEPDDHEIVEDFYRDILKMQEKDNGNNPSMEIRLRDNRKQQRTYFMTATHVNSSLVIICLKDETSKLYQKEHETRLQVFESMFDHLDSVISRHTLGMFSFRYDNGFIYPIFATRSAMNLLRSSEEELVTKIDAGIPTNEILERTGIAYDDFMKLIRDGEAQLYLSEKDTGIKWRVKAVCRNFIPDQLEVYDIIVLDDRESRKLDSMTRNMLMQDLKGEREKTGADQGGKTESVPGSEFADGNDKKIFIQTFGFFEIFVDGSPIPFRHEKSKEMLAVLVDRRGGFLTAAEMVSYLWENEPADKVTLARCRKTAMYLKQELEEYGVDDIIDISNGKRRINPEKVSCDLYDFLTDKGEGKKGFYGTYMKNYSWSEITLSELLSMSE